MKKINIEILGSSGYAGKELLSIANQHPHIGEIKTPTTEDNKDISAVHSSADCVFLALPHGSSAQYAEKYLSLGAKVIDLSGDLRLNTADAYKKSYGYEHPAPHLLPVAYGLPEKNTEDMSKLHIVAMPGCYPTAVTLGVLPLLHAEVLDQNTDIHVCGISGASGAGKTPSQRTHFVELSGNAIPYKVGKQHQHVEEMEQIFNRNVFFTPTLIPIPRGLLTITTVKTTKSYDQSSICSILKDAYAQSPFVDVRSDGSIPTIQDTLHQHHCAIGVTTHEKTVQIISSLDNLLKGAASQAMQVFNIMHSLDETTGLKGASSYDH
jgi:N-acetyl-gamma-glutamyl-phosphate reductase